MFIHTLESLEEFEDYIEQLEETVGLTHEAYKEVKTAISKERTKLKKLLITDVIVPKGKVCPHCGGSGEDGHDRCDPPSFYVCEKCNGSGQIAL